jgi:hypothetical protein
MSLFVKRIAIPLAALGLFLVPATSRAASDKHAFSGVPVTGTASPDGDKFSGTIDVLGFINDASDAEHPLKAVASLTGATSGARGPVRRVTNAIILVPVVAPALPALEQQQQGFGGRALSSSAPQAAQTAGCQVLDLVLGPLHLDLLGLVVDLNQVHLNITAQPGNGNLLGNLVCAIANLLNGTGGGNAGAAATLVNSLATLLNNLLALL